LEVRDDLAHRASKYEIAKHLANKREGHAEYSKEKVRDSLKNKI